MTVTRSDRQRLTRLVGSRVDLEEVARRASDRLPISRSVGRLIAELERPDWRAAAIADIVGADAALAARVLRAASATPADEAHTDVDDLAGALARLGPGLTLALAVGESLREPFQADVPLYGLGAGVLWRHSIAAVLATEESTRLCRVEALPTDYAAAFLHDAGKLVLGRFAGEETLDRLVAGASPLGLGRHATRAVVLEVVLEVCHAELGALLVEAWGLSDPIADAVRHHHSPLMANGPAARRLCSQLLLADSVAALVGIPCGSTSPPAFDPALAGSLAIGRADYLSLVARVGDRLDGWLELCA